MRVRPRGICPECGKEVAIIPRTGLIQAHGMTKRPDGRIAYGCRGRWRPPARIVSA